ncbi:tetratricopeptide repeat protein [Zavarzinella formosa]|uniref:tetratricopeptide repeat protein n=1 Tax=Zavarzinella formosa TaxID=360055 RepID=UPI00030D3BEB|nr:tetratricopeptide repeat protein [Zavarzinella formosa]
MKRLLLAALLTLMLVPAASHAQYFNYIYRNTPYGQAYAYRQQFGPFVSVSQGFRPYYGTLPYYLNAYGAYNPYYNPYYNLNYSNFSFAGYSPYQFQGFQQPAQVVIQQPIIIQQPGQVQNNGFPAVNLAGLNGGNGIGFGGGNGIGFGGNNNAFNNNNNNNVPLMPQKFGGGLAIPADVKPPEKAEAPKVAAIPKVGKPPKEEVAKAPVEPAPKAEAPKVADKLAGVELARKAVESGRIAFGSGEYGRAMELFRKAAGHNPNDPVTYYLLAQTQFAVGKYREAVASISAGMTLKGDWSAAKFEPRNLYGKQPEQFDEHMNQLRGALIQYPDDASLSFLLGHQLWFDGKKDVAKPHLLKAKAAGRGASPAEMFVIP